jgi:sarcosine oxidase/L-pipecolate oxidase
VGIKTKDGRTHYCDQLVLATGSWTPSIINMHRQVLASGQIVVHFKLSKKDQEVLKTLPVWIADASRKGFYGFPYCHDGILKIAKHSPVGYLNPRGGDQVSVPRTQSTNVQDTIPLVALKEFRQFLNEFLPLTSSLDIVYSRVCWYSDSIDGGFVIGPHPDFDNLIVATGDSGHGMK